MARATLLSLLTLAAVGRPSDPAAGEDTSPARVRRSLLFPPGNSRVQLITGFGIPIPLENHAITLGVVIKYNYALPTNASELLQGYVVSAREGEGEEPPPPSQYGPPSRWAVYEGIETAISRLGLGLDGRQCLLRAICEAAATPFEKHSLWAELMYILLTPSSTKEASGLGAEPEYAAAERAGRESRSEGKDGSGGESGSGDEDGSGGKDGCEPFRRRCALPLLGLVSRIAG